MPHLYCRIFWILGNGPDRSLYLSKLKRRTSIVVSLDLLKRDFLNVGKSPVLKRFWSHCAIRKAKKLLTLTHYPTDRATQYERDELLVAASFSSIRRSGEAVNIEHGRKKRV